MFSTVFCLVQPAVLQPHPFSVGIGPAPLSERAVARLSYSKSSDVFASWEAAALIIFDKHRHGCWVPPLVQHPWLLAPQAAATASTQGFIHRHPTNPSDMAMWAVQQRFSSRLKQTSDAVEQDTNQNTRRSPKWFSLAG